MKFKIPTETSVTRYEKRFNVTLRPEDLMRPDLEELISEALRSGVPAKELRPMAKQPMMTPDEPPKIS